jgi:hypothetical protein
VVARLTSTAWFGPKRRAGWGWTPTSWQGWAFTLIWTVVVVVITIALVEAGQVLAMFVFEALALAAMLAVTLVTGDPPGGPGLGP